MRNLIITSEDSNQRLDKFLFKYMNKAPKGFIYKMIRKKNIVLNDKRADGSDIIKSGDEVKLYLADDTIDKFSSEIKIDIIDKEIDIVFEDENIIIVNKPVGLLSQSDGESNDNMNSRLLSYLYKKGEFDTSKESTFTPGVSNRLDRNTSGIMTMGKNLRMTQDLNNMFKDNLIDKFYTAIVHGKLYENLYLKGYHYKDGDNKYKISKVEVPNSREVNTEIYPLEVVGNYTFIKINLITGRTHQIRTHLQSINHPILGDKKYGIKDNIKYQLLHGEEIVIRDKNNYLFNKSFVASRPKEFEKIYNEIFR